MSTRVCLPSKEYSGYIFDLDGTLVDSMKMHYRAWRAALAAHGASDEVFRVKEFVSNGGRAALDIVQTLNEKYGLSMDAALVAVEKREGYMSLLKSEQLPCVDACMGLIRRLKEQGVPYAIGTGSALPGALSTLRSAGVEDLFDGVPIITPDEVAPGRGKPQPDIFLLCAERLGVPAKQCIVFEDAQPGVQAALAAGMDYCLVGEPDMSDWDA